jgi:anaerobic nitric oxide reductase transcription regulator
METIDTIIAIAVDLTTAMKAADRYERLLVAIERVVPYDAAALLRVDGEDLIPVATRGLLPEATGRRYNRKEHPRLDIICNADEPVRFPADNALPDPFDGLLKSDTNALAHIHACLGCPLKVDNQLVGVLTADALNPKAFDHVNLSFLKAIGALAGAQMQTAHLIDALELHAERQGQIVSDLMQDIRRRQGTQILGSSSVMVHLRKEIDLVARSDFTVLVLGETGVGKELVVRAIQQSSNRKDGPMLYLNCAALPETLAESELFGHIKGAFTSADKDRAGKFELADNGTLFLDEIGELPLSIQAKLLRSIQEGEIQRVGSDKTIRVNVRLLAATNRDLETEVRSGLFRADLFHRLNVYPISVPPLRERISDIPVLTGHFCEQVQRRLGLKPVRISPDAYDVLSKYHWPGNVRELENIISRAALKASSKFLSQEQIIIGPEDLGADFSMELLSDPVDLLQETAMIDRQVSLTERTQNFQKRIISQALEKNNGNWAAASRDLNMHRSNLHNLATRLGLRQKRS